MKPKSAGNVQVSTLLLIILVVSAGSASFGALGGGFQNALLGSAGSHSSPVVSSGSQAVLGSGIATAFTRKIGRAGKLASKECGRCNKLKGLGVNNTTQFSKEAAGLPYREVSSDGRFIRVGFPDYNHELPQAERFARYMGGGIYKFPETDSLRGVDGLFVPNDGMVRLVSLKDYSDYSGPADRPLEWLLGNVPKASHTFLESGAHTVFPGGLDLVFSMRQTTTKKLIRLFREHPELKNLVYRADGSKPFDTVHLEASDGWSRLSLDEDLVPTFYPEGSSPIRFDGVETQLQHHLNVKVRKPGAPTVTRKGWFARLPEQLQFPWI